MIGNGPDIEQFNREEEKQIKLQDKVQAWWDGLDDNRKYELLEPYYPDKLHLMGMDEAWEGIDWSERVSLWEEALEWFHGVKV